MSAAVVEPPISRGLGFIGFHARLMLPRFIGPITGCHLSFSAIQARAQASFVLTDSDSRAPGRYC
jgi:hypothetical protein